MKVLLTLVAVLTLVGCIYGSVVWVVVNIALVGWLGLAIPHLSFGYAFLIGLALAILFGK